MPKKSENKKRKRNRDYSEYKSSNKGEFVTRNCLRCNRKVTLRIQYRLCPRCRERSEIYAIEDHTLIF